MWPRVVEIMLAHWLAVSPFIFAYRADQPALWINDYVACIIVITASSLSYYHPWRKAHFVTLVVGLALIAHGFLGAAPPPPPPYQNYVLVGFLLGMFALLPSRCDVPPQRWQDFYAPYQEPPISLDRDKP